MASPPVQAPLRRTLVWAIFCVGYLAAYFISTAVPTPLIWHLPVERRFTFEVRPLALGADFYGRVLLSLVAGALCAGATRLALRARRIQPRPQWLQAALAWMLGLLIFTAGLYLYILPRRQPIPASLPASYVPR